MTRLDNSKEPDEREQELRFHLGRLKEDARWCSNAINKILQLHVRFASLMAQRIDNASKSQCNLKYDDSETTRIANDIREASRSLSKNVTDMAYDLNLFMSALEEVQVPVKERSLADKLREWLKYFLRVIVSIVTAVCSPISTHLSRIGSPQYLTSAVSTLGKTVAEFCRVDPENESESLDPREVQNAQEKLKEFDEALNIMGLAGQRVTLYGPDLATEAEEWRNLAKQYQSMLPVDEDPAC
ncbi:hypothetical protein BGY98DRAFT_109186 [Russula aff. rugulosa BPL654]|nr:hypothetical protein BGY98DRAFT_109186 [Russula aff. rugulosa BPL654]